MSDDTTLSTLQTTLRKVLDHSVAYRTDQTALVAPQATRSELQTHLTLPLPQSGTPAEVVIEELIAAVVPGLVNTSGPRFFGWVIGGSLPASLAADWLTSAWDQNACLYTAAPSAAIVEEVAGAWLKSLLGLPGEASFALVTGCQLAHVTCLAAARHRLLAERGWDVERDGLAGAPAIRILTSTEVHGTVWRAARLLGFGTRSVVTLPVDDEGRLPESVLRDALEAAPDSPTIVLLQAGDLNIGAFDDFTRLIPLAKAHGAWVHIDGAFGLWLNASPRYRSLLAGVEMADSWATDGHKWLNVPYDCGYAFVRDIVAHRAAFTHQASYLGVGSAARDPMDWTPEWSRRARAFPTYAALRELGRNGVEAMIAGCCQLADALTTQIGALPGAELVCRPQMNQGLVRFLCPSADATVADHDAFTDAVTAAILAEGTAYFTNSTWRGRRVMRISVCNWQTSPHDVALSVSSVSRVLARLLSA